MKYRLSFLAILFMFFIAVSCSSDDDTNNPDIVIFNATLNGGSEVPANNSAASGTAVLTYNKATKTFAIRVIYSGITPTMGHIHLGAVDVSGPVVFPFDDLRSPISYVSPVLTAEQEADLLVNRYYVNLHTEAFPNGEIRGQLINTKPGSGGN